MSVILTTLGWLTETFISGLIQKASELAFQRWWFDTDDGDGDALDKLRSSLLTVQPIISKAQNMWIEDEILKRSVNELLLRLKDAVYDAGDLLDELHYRSQQQLIQRQGNDSTNLASSSYGIPPSKKIKTSLLYASRSFLGKRDDKDDSITKEMKEKHENLVKIATQTKETIAWIEANGRGKELMLSSVSRKTSSLVQTQLFGREKELKELEGLLSELEDGSNSSSPSTVTIVGIGGVGKTTLVQEAYNKLVEGCFDCKFWVCVSENFSVERLTREMIESATKETCELMNFDTLQLSIKEKIASKRFLLVLDDVWELDRQQWEKFCSPLRFGAPGSKILVSTRFKNIADIVGSANTIDLYGLDERSFWEYFKNCAFISKMSGDYSELEVIAKKNIYKLKGLPLAARTLGGLLNQNMNMRHWGGILESEIWRLPQTEKDILPVLQISYQYLPTHLKPCFAFCSLFPKDFKFQERNLIYIWIAEGYIAPKEDMRMEDIGSIYFHDLVKRSFFQQSQYEGEYVIHDLIHDLAELISAGECCRTEGNKQYEIPSMIRHLSMFHTKLPELNDYNKLRTLILISNFSEPISMPTCHTLFQRLKRINVLVLQHCHLQELPDSIGNLVHLRLLDISYNYSLIKLPESLCNLYNLQMLILKSCHKLRRLPHNMCKLINLRQLVARDEIISTISEIGKLTSLQQLSVFKVSKKHGHKIEELNHLKQLQGMLHIKNLENIVSKDEARKGKLNNKKHLEALKFGWSPPCETNLRKQQLIIMEEILEALKPNLALKLLTIKGYKGARAPSWLKAEVMYNLKTLKLVNCKRWKNISYIEQLPHLKVFHMEGIPVIKQISPQFYSHARSKFFPMLEELYLQNVPALEDIHNVGQLPYLKILHIKNIPVLRHIVHPICSPKEGTLFPVLRELVLEDLLVLEEIPNLGQLSCLKILRIKRAPSLKHIGHRSFGSIEMKTSSFLEELVLEDLPILEELPNLRQLPCLKVIEMMKFSSLKYLGHLLCDLTEQNIFLKLQELVLWDLIGLEEIPNLWQLPYLEYLCIGEIPKLKMIGHGFFGADKGKCFPCLERLVIGCMPEWEEWSWPKDQPLFPCLHVINIFNCQKLKRLPPLPCSLESLSLRQVGLIELPRFSNITASLSFFNILGCPNLRSLEEGLLMHHLPNIKSIQISECEELMRLPVKSFKELTSLEKLAIRRCPKLMAQDEKFDLLPPSIKDIEFHGYGDLNKFLPSYLHKLISSVTHLSLGDYPYLVSLPRVFLDFKKIVTLSIVNCDELRSIQGLGNFESLKRLTIERCPKLLADGGNKHGESLLSLISLRIDSTTLLKLPSIRKTLPSLLELTISSISPMMVLEGEEQDLLRSLTALEKLRFHDCVNLESLPSELHTLSSLHFLELHNCPQVKSLPETGLPMYLTDINVAGNCHLLLQRQSEEYLEKIR